MLRSNLCDYSDAYIVMKGRKSVKGTNNANTRNKKLNFKNNAPFRSCISKINDTFTDNAEDLNIVMPMYNLLEYSDNYSKKPRSLRNYYRDEINYFAKENNNANNFRISNNETTTSKSFYYKEKIIGRMPNNNNILEQKLLLH